MTRQELEDILEAAIRSTTRHTDQQTVITAATHGSATQTHILAIGAAPNPKTALKALKNITPSEHTNTLCATLQDAIDQRMPHDAPVASLILVNVLEHTSILVKSPPHFQDDLFSVAKQYLRDQKAASTYATNLTSKN